MARGRAGQDGAAPGDRGRRRRGDERLTRDGPAAALKAPVRAGPVVPHGRDRPVGAPSLGVALATAGPGARCHLRPRRATPRHGDGDPDTATAPETDTGAPGRPEKPGIRPGSVPHQG